MQDPIAGPALVEVPRVELPRVDVAWRRRLLRWGGGGVVVAFLAVQGLSAWQLRQDNDSLRDTRQRATATAEDLAGADEQLRVAESELAVASEDLADVEGRLAVLEGDLDTRTAEREALLAGLSATVNDLTAKTESLGATRAQLAGQLSEVQALRSCLAGVSQALTLVTFDDHRRALAALDAVEGSCASAEASVALE